jgi:serine/threonine-protein kinase
MSLLRLTPGTIFAGDYEIVAPLAEGGMGSVYVAKQLSTGKERALKVLLPQFVSDERTRDRFTREARAGSQVDSEHVVEVVAAGIDAATGVPWLSMELLRGEDLEAFADRVGPLPPAQVLEIFRQLCHGMGAAHASGLVHRDLKPENVFLATARRVGVPFTVKILDFGIAKAIGESKREVTDAVGTPTWMAPEQTEAGHTVTSAADVWALGLIAFRLLAGMPYWKAANATDVNAMSILREVCFEQMEPASARARALGSSAHFTSDFDGFFARCLTREPEQRIKNAYDVLVAIEPVLIAAGDAAGAELMAVPMEQSPVTLPGAPPFDAFDAYRATDLPATRVGPFSKPANALAARMSAFPSEDVDSYEKRLSRGKIWVWAGVAMVTAVAAAGIWELRARTSGPAPFTGNEHEPNNRAPDATPLPYGEKMRAQIGQRLDAQRSDRDFFRTTFPATTARSQLTYRALPNIAPCLFLYRVGSDEAFARYCAGQPGRDLTIPAMHLEGGDYYIAVMQDREQYTEAPPPPVLENVSDTYELSVGQADPAEDLEVEPNDMKERATTVKPGSTIRGRLAWMRDVDLICTEGPGTFRFTVEDATPRPRGTVLEVTPLGGPTDGMPVRVHHVAAHGSVSERDVKSPYQGSRLRLPTACVSLTLTRDVWATPPLPRVAEAGDQEYVVRVDAL